MGAVPMSTPATRRSPTPPRAPGSRRRGASRLAPSPGLTVTEAVGAVLGRVQGIYMLARTRSCPTPTSPTSEGAGRARLPGGPGHLPDRDRAFADVVLPASSFAEKDGTFTNTERRVQRAQGARSARRRTRPDVVDPRRPDRARRRRVRADAAGVRGDR